MQHHLLMCRLCCSRTRHRPPLLKRARPHQSVRQKRRRCPFVVVVRRALLHLNRLTSLRVFDAPFYDLFCRFLSNLSGLTTRLGREGSWEVFHNCIVYIYRFPCVRLPVSITSCVGTWCLRQCNVTRSVIGTPGYTWVHPWVRGHVHEKKKGF